MATVPNQEGALVCVVLNALLRVIFGHHNAKGTTCACANGGMLLVYILHLMTVRDVAHYSMRFWSYIVELIRSWLEQSEDDDEPINEWW